MRRNPATIFVSEHTSDAPCVDHAANTLDQGLRQPRSLDCMSETSRPSVDMIINSKPSPMFVEAPPGRVLAPFRAKRPPSFPIFSSQTDRGHPFPSPLGSRVSPRKTVSITDLLPNSPKMGRSDQFSFDLCQRSSLFWPQIFASTLLESVSCVSQFSDSEGWYGVLRPCICRPSKRRRLGWLPYDRHRDPCELLHCGPVAVIKRK